MNKKEEQIVKKELQNYQDIINYLIEIYCLNPNEIITANRIEQELKIGRSNILRPFLLELSKKGILKGGLGRYKITFDGFQTLMAMKSKHRSLSISTITLCATVMTFTLTVLENVFNPDTTRYAFIFLIIGTVTIYCINKFMDKSY